MFNMHTLGFTAMLAATSMAAPSTSTFAGPSLSVDSTGIYATTAGTASWEIVKVNGEDKLGASSTLSMTLANPVIGWPRSKASMVAACIPLLTTQYCELFSMEKGSDTMTRWILTAYWKTHPISTTLPQSLYDNEDLVSRLFSWPEGKEDIVLSSSPAVTGAPENGTWGALSERIASDVATLDTSALAVSSTAFTGASKTKGAGVTEAALTAIKEGGKYTARMWVSQEQANGWKTSSGEVELLFVDSDGNSSDDDHASTVMASLGVAGAFAIAALV